VAHRRFQRNYNLTVDNTITLDLNERNGDVSAPG